MIGVGVESCDEPLAGLARLEHGVSDESALTTDGGDLGNRKRSLDRVAQAVRIKLIARAFRVFAQRQQIGFEDFVNLRHLVTANV